MRQLPLTILAVIISLCVTAQSNNDYSEVNRLILEGKLEEAQLMIDKNIDLSNPLYHQYVGELLLRMGRSEDALISLQSAFGIYKKNNQGKTLEASKSIASLAIAQWSLGNNSVALEYALQALSIRHDYGASEELTAAAYNDLGLIYSNADASIALNNYSKAKELYIKHFGDINEKVAQAITNIGIIQTQMEAYQDAIVNFFDALSIWNKLYPNGHPNEAFVYSNIGQTHFESGNLEGAQEYQLKALELYKKTYGEKHPDLANVYNALGRISIRKNEYKTGLEYYQYALIANTKLFNDIDINSNPNFNGYFNPSVLLNSLIYKAEGLESLYYNKTVKFTDLKLALEVIDICDELIDKIRHTRKNEQDKVALGSATSRVYKIGVRTAYAMSELGVDKSFYLQKAFHYAEKSKSAVLLEAVADTKAKSFAQIPSNELKIEDNFKSEITYLEQQLSKESNVEELRNKLFEVSRKYEQFVNTLEQKYPTYYNLKYNVAIPEIKELQAKLKDDALLLSYFIDKENSRLYSFYITNSTYKVFNGSLTENFDRYVAGLRNSIYYGNKEIFTLTASELYKVLFPVKLSSKITRIIIIPAGKLGYIPFEALLSKKPKKDQNNYFQYDYLIKDKAISYAYSSLLFFQGTPRQIEKPSILLCAPIDFTESLAKLPNTRREINAIAQAFKDNNNIANVFLEQSATENMVKTTDLKNYNYLHFATHGIVDEVQPEQSRIYLGETDNEDGRLLCSEIYNLEMNADLVSLSACETGLGKIAQGEGIMGFTRALMYSGAKNTLVSLWSVSDESTADLMIDFYDDVLLNKNMNYQYSLRTAKIAMISSREKASPFYWAPFILIGE